MKNTVRIILAIVFVLAVGTFIFGFNLFKRADKADKCLKQINCEQLMPQYIKDVIKTFKCIEGKKIDLDEIMTKTGINNCKVLAEVDLDGNGINEYIISSDSMSDSALIFGVIDNKLQYLQINEMKENYPEDEMMLAGFRGYSCKVSDELYRNDDGKTAVLESVTGGCGRTAFPTYHLITIQKGKFVDILDHFGIMRFEDLDEDGVDEVLAGKTVDDASYIFEFTVYKTENGILQNVTENFPDHAKSIIKEYYDNGLNEEVIKNLDRYSPFYQKMIKELYLN